MLWKLRASIDLANLYLSQDRGEEAGKILASSLDAFTEGFDFPDLRNAKAVLAKIAEAGVEFTRR